MSVTDKKIGPLDKVRLEFTILPANGAVPVDKVLTESTIIYGIGSEGITPFEQSLHEKKTGDKFSINVDIGKDHELFGHLKCVLFSTTSLSLPCKIDFTIQAVSKAESREIIKMMAQNGSCGSGCDCGCC